MSPTGAWPGAEPAADDEPVLADAELGPGLVDSHAHLVPPWFTARAAAAALERGRAAGLVAVIDVGTRLEDSRRALALAEREADVFATAGVHPHHASTLDEAALAALGELAPAPRVVAVGECGLDYHYDRSPRDAQRQALRRQIRLARAVGKPLVLHDRDADDDFLAILDEEGAAEVGGVVHAFAATWAVAERLLAAGFHLGFGGMVTFDWADHVRQALCRAPLERVLLETDSPYLTPAGRRGKKNEPALVRLVAERAAAERGLDLALLAWATTRNARSLFRLPLA